MRYHHLFIVKEGSPVERAVEELCFFLTDLYEVNSPETGVYQIGGYSDKKAFSEKLEHSALEASDAAEEVDWEKQWSTFSPNFEQGFARVDLKEFGGPCFLMKPGAGFGDLSHPTTRLTLALMAPLVKDKVVFDIGCGSGVLSIAAALLGATQVYGVDIDEQSIRHSQENAKANQINCKTLFTNALDPYWASEGPCVILMNMIQSEQQVAWDSLGALHKKAATIVTSGLLSTQRDSYLRLTQGWGWTLMGERAEEGWLGFIFLQSSYTPSF
jgi:ribosomal protein L11 methyltransferase